MGALFAAGLATFAVLYSTQALLPEIGADFAVSSGAATLTVSVTTIALAAALLVAGPASDRWGRTRFIHGSLALSTLIAAGCAVAPTWSSLLALRLLAGIALAGLPAVATAYLREELHPSTHGRAAGLYIGGTALGGMAGRLLTGAVGEAAGWRWALGAVALLALACAVAVRRLLPASRAFVPSEIGPGTLRARTRLALADRGLLALYAVGACAMGAQVAVFNTLGFRLESPAFGLGVGAASLVFLVYPLGSLSAIGAGRLADAIGRRAVLPGCCAVAVTGLGLTLAGSLPVVVVGLAVFVVGFFAAHGVASGWVPARAHAAGASAGQSAALYLAAYYVGSSVFGSLGGVAWSAQGWPAVVALAVALVAACGALSLALRRTPLLVAR